MAIIKSFKSEEAMPQPKVDDELPAPVDFNIMEYFYAATMEEILADDSLVKLINSNGFYRTCFCEAFDLYEVCITIGTVEYKWSRPRNIERSNLDIFEHLNEPHNINDIEQYRM